jgi:hypothetical protein
MSSLGNYKSFSVELIKIVLYLLTIRWREIDEHYSAKQRQEIKTQKIIY